MADIDVSDVLSNSDFVDPFKYIRNTQSVNAGVGTVTPSLPIDGFGCFYSKSGDMISRTAPGEYNDDTITVVTTTRLVSGESGATADLVMWNGSLWTVIHVNNYGQYGRGFVEATCELLPMRSTND
jgi:hypothetical protein